MDDQFKEDSFVDHFRRITEEGLEKINDKLNDDKTSKPNKDVVKEVIERQNALLERLMEQSAFIGTVVSINGDQKDKKSWITISCYGKLLDVKPVPELSLKVGDSVRLTPQSSQIIGLAESYDLGSICLVKKIIDNNFSEVHFNGSPRRVLNGQYGESLREDDRVILDTSGSIIIACIGREDSRFRLNSKPDVTWDDICGLDEAKKQLKEIISMPFKFPELYKHHRLERGQPKGGLLSGPPGCGKTMLLEAAANELASMHGAEAVPSGYIYVKGPEILDMYVGNTERNIRMLFAMGRKHKQKHGYPAIIAIDEADALFSKRGSGVSSDMEKTVVPTLLAEVSGIDNGDTILLLCTNRLDVLDPAVTRDGRIDRNVVVSRPSLEAAKAIFKLNLSKYNIDGDPEEMAEYTATEFYSDKYKLYDIVRGSEKEPVTLTFKLSDLINGAMAVGVINRAAWNAFERDLASGGGGDPTKRTKMTREDILRSIEATYREKYPMRHSDELSEFSADFKQEIVSIQKVKQIQL